MFKSSYLYFIGLIACVIFLAKLTSQLEAPLDPGDGLNHFFISQIAPSQPLFFLNHWGKPLFTLLSSPFAFFGMNGMIAFNILLFIGTCVLGFGIFKQLKVNQLLSLFFPLILLYSFDYTSNILGGMTEVLFAFLLVLGGFFLIKQQYFWMVLVVSFLPFSRSEGQLILILAVVILIYNKAYRFLPFLLTGHFIYAVIGLFAFHDFFWYLTQNPYPPTSIYGQGDWNHFWIYRLQYMGKLGLWTAALAGISVVHVLISNKLVKMRVDFLFLTFASFFGILLAHSYFWRYGLNGSLGLTRVMAMVLPIFSIACFYLIQSLQLEKLAFSKIISIASFCFLLFFLVRKDVVVFAGNQSYEKTVLQAAKFMKNTQKKGQKVYYFHPLVAYGLGKNMYATDSQLEQIYISNNPANLERIKVGDFLIRDSHFGPMEMGLPLDLLKSHPEFALINEFIPTEFGASFHGESWNVKVFQKIPVSQQEILAPNSTFIKLDKSSFVLKSTHEFYPIYEAVSTGDEQTLSIDFKCEHDGGFIVFDLNSGATLSSIPLKKGESGEIQVAIQKNNAIKVYFWNPSQEKNNIQVRYLKKTKTVFQQVRTHFDK